MRNGPYDPRLDDYWVVVASAPQIVHGVERRGYEAYRVLPAGAWAARVAEYEALTGHPPPDVERGFFELQR